MTKLVNFKSKAEKKIYEKAWDTYFAGHLSTNSISSIIKFIDDDRKRTERLRNLVSKPYYGSFDPQV